MGQEKNHIPKQENNIVNEVVYSESNDSTFIKDNSYSTLSIIALILLGFIGIIGAVCFT